MIAIGNAVGDAASLWGIHPFCASRAHRWTYRAGRAGGSLIESACGLLLVVTSSVPLLVPGDFVRCKRCSAVRSR